MVFNYGAKDYGIISLCLLGAVYLPRILCSGIMCLSNISNSTVLCKMFIRIITFIAKAVLFGVYMIITFSDYGDYISGKYTDAVKVIYVWMIFGNLSTFVGLLILDISIIISMQVYVDTDTEIKHLQSYKSAYMQASGGQVLSVGTVGVPAVNHNPVINNGVSYNGQNNNNFYNSKITVKS